MRIKRIVADIHTQDIAAAKRFDQDVLGFGLLMDHGWIATYGSGASRSVGVLAGPQIPVRVYVPLLKINPVADSNASVRRGSGRRVPRMVPAVSS